MTTFDDGPAAGVTLWLRRAPLLLRVVRSPAGEWDALDQLDDQPRPQETITVYRRIEIMGSCFVCARGKGGKGGRFVSARYRLHEAQPAEAVASSIRQWRRWAEDQAEALRQPKTEQPQGET